MYVTADGHGMNGVQIFDLNQLRTYSGSPITFEETANYQAITQAHNIAINEETGFAYVCRIRSVRRKWNSLINVAGRDCIFWISGAIRSIRPMPAALPIFKPADMVTGSHTMPNA